MTEHYYQHDRNHKLHKRVRSVKWFFKAGAITLLIAIPFIIIYISFFVAREPDPITSGVRTSTFQSSSKIFRSQYFQFQAEDNWDEDADATTKTRFVYRAYRGPLIEQDLVIEINPVSALLDATHIQAVESSDIGAFSLSSPLSDHCDTDLPEADKDREQQMTLNEVTFLCDADDTIFDVLVGLKGGTPLMKLKRPDGTEATYTIYYRDLRALPTGSSIKGIIQSFQTR